MKLKKEWLPGPGTPNSVSYFLWFMNVTGLGERAKLVLPSDF